MAGVRIQHPTARNVRFIVSDPNIKYSEPRQCTPPEFGGCGQIHIFKTHHVNLDETGAAIIGDELWQKAKAHFIVHGFVETNIVEKPPTLGIGMGPQIEGRGQWGNIPVVSGERK